MHHPTNQATVLFLIYNKLNVHYCKPKLRRKNLSILVMTLIAFYQKKNVWQRNMNSVAYLSWCHTITLIPTHIMHQQYQNQGKHSCFSLRPHRHVNLFVDYKIANFANHVTTIENQRERERAMQTYTTQWKENL